MKPRTKCVTLWWRFYERYDEPQYKIAFVFALSLFGLLAAYALGYVPDPWNRRFRHGYGWECDPAPWSVAICDKDVPDKLQKPRPR